MYDTFSWWGLFTAILIAIILLTHIKIIPGIILLVGVVMIFLLAQWMGVIAGVIACLFSVMPLYNSVTMNDNEPWAKNL